MQIIQIPEEQNGVAKEQLTMSPCWGFSPSLQSFDLNSTGMTSVSAVYKIIPVSPSLRIVKIYRNILFESGLVSQGLLRIENFK